MIAFAWHVFLVVWLTGAFFGAYHVWVRQPHRQLGRQLEAQALQTRLAELQARERKALGV